MAALTDQIRLGRLAVHATAVTLVIATACTAPVTTPAVTQSASQTATMSAAPAVTSSPVRTSIGSKSGACTDPQTTSRGVLDRYFALSTSGDAAAVNDCFAAAWRARNPNFDDASTRWAVSGPATDLQITFLDRTLECDRYAINVRLPTGVFGFYALVGLDGDRQRIHETGTALVRSDLATTRCE